MPHTAASADKRAVDVFETPGPLDLGLRSYSRLQQLTLVLQSEGPTIADMHAQWALLAQLVMQVPCDIQQVIIVVDCSHDVPRAVNRRMSCFDWDVVGRALSQRRGLRRVTIELRGTLCLPKWSEGSEESVRRALGGLGASITVELTERCEYVERRVPQMSRRLW